jgi:hypothetical protein
MKTLSEYQKEVYPSRQTIAWVGVACDRCGAELYNSSPGVLLATDPPKISVRCSKCDFSGYMTR